MCDLTVLQGPGPHVLCFLRLESACLRAVFLYLGRCVERGYREAVSTEALKDVMAVSDVSLCLDDVTTLHPEVRHEDDLRKVGYSKERRAAPQVIGGPGVDRHCLPLQVGC